MALFKLAVLSYDVLCYIRNIIQAFDHSKTGDCPVITKLLIYINLLILCHPYAIVNP